MDDAIQMTAIQSKDKKLDLKPVPVTRLLEDGMSGVTGRARQAGVTLDNHLAHGARWTVLADTGVLKLALTKLLDNAVRHNRNGGVVRVREVTEIPGLGTAADLLEAGGLDRLTGQESYALLQLAQAGVAHRRWCRLGRGGKDVEAEGGGGGDQRQDVQGRSHDGAPLFGVESLL